MNKQYTLALIALFVALPGCGEDGNNVKPTPAGPNLPAELIATFGNYNITYQATLTKVNGSVQNITPNKANATIEIKGSQPGVMGVEPGTIIPGIDPEDVIFGAAYVQNPVHVFMGTDTQDQHGDFGLWSSVWIGLPPNPVNLEYSGCTDSKGPFMCPPVFFQRAEVTDSVNLIYFATSVTEYTNGDITFSGLLTDDHRSEAAAANGFGCLADHDILGEFVDQYLFDEGATFEFTIINGNLTGSIFGVGRSLIGSEPALVSFSMTFGGGKSL